MPGNGTPLLFIHGMWGGATQFEQWMWHAYREGHAVYAVNLRGHHGSGSQSIENVRFEDYINDVFDVIEHIGSMPVIIGHSLGGLIAQVVAEKGWVSKAVFVATAPPKGILLGLLVSMVIVKYLHKILLGLPVMISFHDAFTLLLNNCQDDSLGVYEKLVPESGKVARQVVLGINVHYELPCPTLVIAGEKDNMTNYKVQEKVARRYGSEFESFDRGHMMLVEDGSREVIERILRFV